MLRTLLTDACRVTAPTFGDTLCRCSEGGPHDCPSSPARVFGQTSASGPMRAAVLGEIWPSAGRNGVDYPPVAARRRLRGEAG